MVSYRFEGMRIHGRFMGNENLHLKDYKMAETHLDETEVITRFMFVLNHFEKYDLNNVEWTKNFEDQGIDSLDTIAIITSIEHEFHVVFEDNMFDHF